MTRVKVEAKKKKVEDPKDPKVPVVGQWCRAPMKMDSGPSFSFGTLLRMI